MTENDKIHPAVQLVAEDLKKAYEKLQRSQTPEAKEAARINVLGELLAASIITQYTEHASVTKP